MSPASKGWFRELRLWTGFIIHRKSFTSRPSLAKALKLRDYQEDCIRSILSSLNQGKKRLGVSLATGGGKTVVFTELIDRIKSRGKNGNQTLILAHRKELVEQAAKHIMNFYPKKTIELEMGHSHATGLADITVASVQSITSGSRLLKFNPNRFKLVVVDEAHHIVSSSYMKTLEHFGLSKKRKDSPVLVGVSATLSRSDGLELRTAIDEIVYHKDYVAMIDEKWLSGAIFTTVKTNVDLSKIRSGAHGDFETGELSKLINTEEISSITVRSWLEKCGDRKSTLVFCIDVNHVTMLTNNFRRYGVDARFVVSGTPKLERFELLENFKRGEFPVLVNCGIFTEGTDVPNIDCVLIVRPTKSKNLLLQMIGRGLRLDSRKVDCHIIDIVTNFDKGIISTPTLFGLDPDEVVDRANIDDMKRKKRQRDAEKENNYIQNSDILEPIESNMEKRNSSTSREIEYNDYLSAHEFVHRQSGESIIRDMSLFAWVRVGNFKYVLAGGKKSYLCLEKDPSKDIYNVDEREFKKILRGDDRKEKKKKPFKIGSYPEFSDAVEAADSYAKFKYPIRLITSTKKWRDRPASQEQINYLNSLRKSDRQLDYFSLTMGRAGDMIMKLRCGS